MNNLQLTKLNLQNITDQAEFPSFPWTAMILQEDFVTGDSELKINAIAESTKTKFEKK